MEDPAVTVRPRFLAVCLASVLAGCSGGGAPTSVSSPATPDAASSGASAAPAPTKRAAPPTEAPRVPVAATFDGIQAMSLSLGDDAAPIDITYAFGSIWIANHHSDTVVRLEPDTMEVQATIPAGSGPGWFVVTDDTVWVSDQNGRGMTRIDPTTNVAIEHIGQGPPCGRGLAALGYVWQPACDSQVIMRIDPRDNTSFDVSMSNANSIAMAGTALIAGGDGGLARVDPISGSTTPMRGPKGMILGYAARALWISTESEVLLVRPGDGKVLTRIPAPSAGAMFFAGNHAWVAGQSPKLIEIDVSSRSILRSITFDPWPASVVEVAGHVWVTNFERSSVVRLDL
jgi:YVTN family beta-propeller protein